MCIKLQAANWINYVEFQTQQVTDDDATHLIRRARKKTKWIQYINHTSNRFSVHCFVLDYAI